MFTKSVMEPVQRLVLKWVRIWDHNINSIEDIPARNSILEILQNVPSFRLTDKLSNQPCLTLTDKLTKLRIIVKSITKFYQQQMCRDVSQMKVNAFEICNGNKEEIVRLMIMVIGLVNCQQNSNQIEIFMSQLSSQDQQIFKALLNSSKLMGLSENDRNDSPEKHRKLIGKLQQLEEQVDILEEQREVLQRRIEGTLDENDKVKKELEEISETSSTLIRKLEKYQIVNDKLENEVKCKQEIEQKLKKQLQTNKEIYLNRAKKTEEQKQKLEDIIKELQKKIQKYQNKLKNSEQNHSIQRRLEREKHQLQQNHILLKEQIKQIHIKYLEAVKQNQSLKLTNEELSLKNALISSSKEPREPIFMELSNYYPKDTLSFLNDQKHIIKNFTHRQALEQIMNRNDSLTQTIRSNRSNNSFLKQVNIPEDNKQNINIFANIKIDKNQKDSIIEQMEEQRSFDLAEQQEYTIMALKKGYEQQMGLLISVVLQLRREIEIISKQLRQYELKKKNQTQRTFVFMKKVNAMFQ